MFGIYNLFDNVARTLSDRTLVVEQDMRLSYGEMGRMTNRLAYGLKRLGIKGGSNVGYIMFNGYRTILTFFALQKLGTFMTPFNFRFPASEMSEYISLIGCEFFIYGKEFETQAAEIKEKHPDVVWIAVDDNMNSDPTYAELMDNDADDWRFFEDMPGDAPAIGILTGGTTGRSKAAVHSKYGMLMQQCTRQAWLYTAEYISVPMVYLLISPLFHVGGIGPMFNVISAGGTIVLAGKFDPERLAMLISGEKVTDMVLIPPNLAQSIKDAGIHKKYDLSSVRYVGIGGGTITPSHVRVVHEVFPNAGCDLMYSQSEYATFISHVITPEILENKPYLIKSVGKPVYFTEAKILREDGTGADTEEIGELYARCTGMMSGYLGQTKSPFVDGWLPTGDLFKKDADGNYYFVDRKKDMIKSGGENVYTAEVEGVIKQIPGVSEVAVFGLPDDFYGEAVSAAIVLGPGAALTEKEVSDFCKEHIASYKKPRHVFFMTELPKSGAGKVQKMALKQMLTNQL